MPQPILAPYDPKDPMSIPPFLRREVTPETIAARDQVLAMTGGGGQRVWIMPDPNKKRVTPKKHWSTAHPEAEVRVVTGTKGAIKGIAIYDNWAEFLAEHDQDDYPIQGVHDTGGETIVHVKIATWVKPADGSTAPPKERQAGTGGQIWKRADELWAAAGSPKDPKVVLKLRKEWMVTLEGEGIKKTTSSSELGQWMKARLA